MKTFYCPIDTSLNFQQANKLIKELKPTILVTPEPYTKPHPAAPNLFIEQQVASINIKIIIYIFVDFYLLPILG